MCQLQVSQHQKVTNVWRVFYEERQINIQHGFKMCNSSILLHDVSLKVSTLYTDTVLLEWAVRLKTSRNFS